MRKALYDWAKSKRGIVTIAVSLSFVFGMLGLTLVQAPSYDRSRIVTIYDDSNLIVTLQIHHYQILPNHAMFHAILKFTNNYDEDIMVDSIHIESWNCAKSGCPGSESLVLYGEANRTAVFVPAQETTKMQLNQKAQHFDELVLDQDVYNYFSISWTHGTNSYSKAGCHIEDATVWWPAQLWG